MCAVLVVMNISRYATSKDAEMATASTIMDTLTDAFRQANARVCGFGNRIMFVIQELATDSLPSCNSVWPEPIQAVDVDVDELMEDMTNAVFGVCYAERLNRAAMMAILALWNVRRVAFCEEFRAEDALTAVQVVIVIGNGLLFVVQVTSSHCGGTPLWWKAATATAPTLSLSGRP